MNGGIVMWTIFMYFLIFFVPGLFAVIVYNVLSNRCMECWQTIVSALVFDLLIMDINFAGLRFIKGIGNCKELQEYFCCLSFLPKYMLLCLIVGTILAVIAWLLSHLICWCRLHFHHHKKNC